MIENILKRALGAKDPETWPLGDESWPVVIQRRPSAKRITIRVCSLTDTLRMTAPQKCSTKTLRTVLHDHTSALTQRVKELPPRQPFLDQATLPFLDGTVRLSHRPGQPTRWEPVEGEADQPLEHLIIGGREEHLPRRARDAFRKRAKEDLTLSCKKAWEQASKTHHLRPIRRISLSDTRGRWGSCSSDGTLRFSWRLIFAPQWVFDYVAAHEVAHLAEMSHSPRYWAVVASITPEAKAARQWLKRYGSQIQRIGPAI